MSMRPYPSLDELPEGVRRRLPVDGQQLYFDTFNEAWQRYADPAARPTDEPPAVLAHRAAWRAVRAEFEADAEDRHWRRRSRPQASHS